jgi:hypothetical protein
MASLLVIEFNMIVRRALAPRQCLPTSRWAQLSGFVTIRVAEKC